MNSTKLLALAGLVSVLSGCAFAPVTPARPPPAAYSKPETPGEECSHLHTLAVLAAAHAAQAGYDPTQTEGEMGGFEPCEGAFGKDGHERYLAAERVYEKCLDASTVEVTGTQLAPGPLPFSFVSVPVDEGQSHDWRKVEVCMAAHGQ